MFVRYYLELPLAAAEVEQTLVDAPPGWLATLSTAAQERGQGLAARVGVEPGIGVGPGVGVGTGPRAASAVARPGRRVVLELGPPVHLPTMTWLPLRWEPVGLDGLLPRLDATIELGPLGEDRTQVAISAQFQQPPGPGQGIDRGLAQRVAEATLKDFLDQLGHAIVLSHLGPTANMPP
jgi:hypothetical protein